MKRPLFILFCAILLVGCSTVKYVPVETIKTEYISNTVHDSIYIETLKHDSVMVEKRGDTVFVDRWHTLYKDRWREKLVTDTIIKTDSIQVPFPVEKQLTKWQNICIRAGEISLFACLAIIMVLILCIIFRSKIVGLFR